MPLDWKHLPIYHISYRKQFLLHIAFHDDWEKTERACLPKFLLFWLKNSLCVCVCVCVYNANSILIEKKGIIYILSSFYISIKLISPPSPLPFESNSVGMWRVMSPLVKNGHLCIHIVISTILPWLLLHKMKPKVIKMLSEEVEVGGRRNGEKRMEEKNTF